MHVKSWNINDLKDRFNYYKNLLKRTKSSEEKDNIVKAILSYKYFIDDYYKKYPKPSFSSIVKQDRNFFEEAPITTTVLVNANNYILSNGINLKDNIVNINISKDKILTTTRDFYENIGGIFFEKYQEYYDRGSIYINFTSFQNKNIGGNILRPEGETAAYININTFHSLFDIATSVHEHAHAIGASINEVHLKDPLINELESIFFELLYLDSIDKTEYDFDNIKSTKEASLSMYHRDLNSVDAKYISTLQGLSDRNKIISVIRDKYDIEDEFLDDILLDSMQSFSTYSLSYLIAIELFLLYKKNNYAALNILEQLIKNNKFEENILFDILESYRITPGKNLKSFYKQFLNIKGTSKSLH